MKENGDYCTKQKQKKIRRSSKEKVIIETRKRKKEGKRDRKIERKRDRRNEMRARKTVQDEEDERSATRIG